MSSSYITLPKNVMKMPQKHTIIIWELKNLSWTDIYMHSLNWKRSFCFIYSVSEDYIDKPDLILLVVTWWMKTTQYCQVMTHGYVTLIEFFTR